MPMQHDSAAELAQPFGEVKNWKEGDCEPIPGKTMAIIKVVERAYADTELRLGRPGSDDEVAAVLGVGVDAFHKMLAEVAQASVLSLDETLFSGDGESTVRVVDTVEDAHASADTNRQVERRERNETLGQAIDRLPEREKHVLSLY